jgi:hypothetical protein
MHKVLATHTQRSLRSSTRALHTSRAVLAGLPKGPKSPLERPPPSHSTVSPIGSNPEDTKAGKEAAYVQTQPKASDHGFAVPPGPFPSAQGYESYPATDRPSELDAPISSASPNRAHPVLTKKVPTNETGVRGDGGIGASASVRHTTAPGEMGTEGGSHGGKDMADASTTKKGELGELPDVNDVPLFENTERLAKAGVKDGWKQRK